MKHSHIMQVTHSARRLIAGCFPSVRRGAHTLALVGLLAVGAVAQRCVLKVQVDCSNIPGSSGQGVIDQPRKVEVDVEITKPDGTTTSTTISATLLRSGTARLAAVLLAGQVNGKGTNPQQNCDVDSADPSSSDWVDREHEVDLKLPDGVKVKKIRVFKLRGKTWVTSESGCVGHLKVSEVVTKSSGGIGRLVLRRDNLDPFGLTFEVSGVSAHGDDFAFLFENTYLQSASSSMALAALADALTEARFSVEVDDESVWILSSPCDGNVEAVYGVWHNDEPYFVDDEDCAESFGESSGWSGVEVTYSSL